VFQELDGLRADVATLMSTADSSSFMQIVDIVQSVNAAQKDVVTFRKAFNNTEFCCDDTVYSPPTEPDDTTAPQVSHCQRVQWLRDAALGLISEFQKFVIDGKLTKLNDATVASLYQTRFGVAMDSIKLPYFARMIRNIATWGTDNLPENFPYPEMANGYLDTLWNYFVEIEGFSFSTDIDGNDISSQKGFLCAMYDAQTPLEAYQNWQTSLQAYFGARLSGNSPLDSEMYWVLLNMMGGSLLDGIFAGTIPADPADVAGYDNIMCVGCISPGGGDCPLAPGESVDIPSGGSFNIEGAQRETIVWPTSGSWANIPRNSGNYGVPGGNLQTDCVAGWEVSFPFDQLSNDTFRFTYKPDGLTYTQVDISGSGTWTVPANTVELMVFRSGSGTPWDRPFTLRVTRPA
jgi:hypothetical protein